jgi:hypothetical protein
MKVVTGASLFEEPGKLSEVADLAPGIKNIWSIKRISHNVPKPY